MAYAWSKACWFILHFKSIIGTALVGQKLPFLTTSFPHPLYTLVIGMYYYSFETASAHIILVADGYLHNVLESQNQQSKNQL